MTSAVSGGGELVEVTLVTSAVSGGGELVEVTLVTSAVSGGGELFKDVILLFKCRQHRYPSSSLF